MAGLKKVSLGAFFFEGTWEPTGKPPNCSLLLFLPTGAGVGGGGSPVFIPPISVFAERVTGGGHVLKQAAVASPTTAAGKPAASSAGSS